MADTALRWGSRGPRRSTARSRPQLALSRPSTPACWRSSRRTAWPSPPSWRSSWSSALGLAQPFLLKAVFDDALPHNNIRVLLLAVGGMLAVTIATSLLGVVQTWMSTKVGPAGHAPPRSDVSPTSSANRSASSRAGQAKSSRASSRTSVACSRWSPRPRRRSGNLTTAVGTAVAMAALELAAVPALPARSPAVDVLTPAAWRCCVARSPPPCRPAQPICTSRSTKDCRSWRAPDQDAGAGRLASRRFRADVRRTRRSRASLGAAGRWRMATRVIVFAAIPALIYPRGRFPATSGDDHRHVGGLHQPAGGDLPAADGPAQRRCLVDLLDGLFWPDLRLPRPGDRCARAGRARPVPAGEVQGHIRFDHVSFTYAEGAPCGRRRDAPDIPAGSSLALVGDTGSNKSTCPAWSRGCATRRRIGLDRRHRADGDRRGGSGRGRRRRDAGDLPGATPFGPTCWPHPTRARRGCGPLSGRPRLPT